MEYKIGADRPAHFQAEWPEQFDIFSHLEFACGIPQLLFAVTTYKPGGVPNVCRIPGVRLSVVRTVITRCCPAGPCSRTRTGTFFATSASA